jgi:hypothetical protein
MKTDKVYCIFIFSLSKKRGMGCMIIGYGHTAKETKMEMRRKPKKLYAFNAEHF